MAVYDQSYAPWQGSYDGRLRRIAALVRPGLGQPFASFWIRLVVILSFVLVAAWMIVLLSAATQAARNPKSENLIRMLFAVGNNIYRVNFFNHEIFSMLLLTLSVAVGAPLISRDLRHNALLMYFSRAITRGDYLLAKYLTLVLFLLLVTWGPAALLWLGQIAMGVEKLTLGQRLADLASLTGHSLILVVPSSAAALACSSVTKRPYVAAILWASIFLASLGFEWLLSELLKEDWCGLLSWNRLTAHLGDALYQDRKLPGFSMSAPKPHLETGVLAPFLILASITAASLALVRFRLRSVEAGE